MPPNARAERSKCSPRRFKNRAGLSAAGESRGIRRGQGARGARGSSASSADTLMESSLPITVSSSPIRATAASPSAMRSRKKAAQPPTWIWGNATCRRATRTRAKAPARAACAGRKQPGDSVARLARGQRRALRLRAWPGRSHGARSQSRRLFSDRQRTQYALRAVRAGRAPDPRRNCELPPAWVPGRPPYGRERVMDASASRTCGTARLQAEGRHPLGAGCSRQPLLAVWPRVCGPMSAIADSGDSRVLHWDASP